MPGYTERLLQKCQHNKPIIPTYSPYQWTPPTFGQSTQYTKPHDDSPKLDTKQKRYVQSVIGSLLYYSRAVDPTMLMALNELSAEQANPTEKTLTKINRLLNYVATYPNAILRFHSSDMALHVDTDAAYLAMPNARSRIVGHYYLSDHPETTKSPKPNGPILTECRTLQHVVASAAEAETAGIFHNARTALPIRNMLHTLGHPQSTTPIKTDNPTAANFVSKNIKQKLSKSWEMRLNWLRDRTLQKQFKVFWDKGSNNWADYFTKHHSAKHHRVMRPKYVHMEDYIKSSQKCDQNLITSQNRRGCVDLMAYDSHSHRNKWDPNTDDVNSIHVISPLVQSRPLAVNE